MDIWSSASPVFASLKDGIGTVYLNRPHKKNALTADMWEGVREGTSALAAEPGCRVICLRSTTPGVFAAGADIAELQQAAEDGDLRRRTQNAIRTAQRTLARVDRPTIAVIDGPCVGGGCGLALHTDFRIASTRALFGITPAKLGIVYPQSDMKRLYEIVGGQTLRRMLFLAERCSAEQALTLGLIDWCVEPEGVDGVLQDTLASLLSLSQTSIQEMKRQLVSIEDGAVDDTEETLARFLELQTESDAVEGLAAFLEKRPARFR